MNNYEHTETGWVVIWVTCAACAAAGLVFLFAPPCGGQGGLYFVAGILASTLLMFYDLTVTVDQSTLRLRFGVGLVGKTVPLSDIVSVGAVRTSLISGWGIHYVGGGWLYNINSRDAVELRLRSGGRLLIGTDDQAGLLAALSALPRHDSPSTGK